MKVFSRRTLSRVWVSWLAVLVLLAGCGTARPSSEVSPADVAAVSERLSAIAVALQDWSGASSIEQAHTAAATISMLITGPDTTVEHVITLDGVSTGLLPGETGTPGLAIPLEPCLGSDMLGGSWSDPAQRWAEFHRLFDEWSPQNNTFPQLDSHPQRTVGWAQLALGTDDLALAREYSRHAALHVAAAESAFLGC